jgi:hypothetical protein
VRQVLPIRQPCVPSVTKFALKEATVKPKVSPASVVEKSWIAGGVFAPCEYGIGPVVNVIGLPSVKKLKKVPPIAPATTEVWGGAKVRDEAVKESVPVAEKKPLMESAWATATVLTAMAVNTTRRLSMVGLREQFEVRETFLALSFRRCPPN